MVGGIYTAHYGFSFVEIEPNPMVDWHNASGVTDSDADELAFLIGLLLKSVNLYTAYYIRQWRDNNRLRLL